MATDRFEPRRIRDLMVMMGYCALYLALVRLTGPGLFFCTIGPVCGVAIQRLLGGQGITGGIVGGASTYACWVGFAFVAYGHSGFGYTELVWMITVMAVEGAVAGFTAGALMWVGARWLASWRCGQIEPDMRGVLKSIGSTEGPQFHDVLAR
jgi:hypothetical protein